MSKPSSRRIPFHAYFLAALCFSNTALAAEQTYVREYVYQASEIDSKVTARAIALQEVKRILLSELGTHVGGLGGGDGGGGDGGKGNSLDQSRSC